MISDDERREVARKLRELAGGYVTIGELESALGICLSSPEVDLERDERDLHRLADLIEPSEPEVKYVAEVKVDGWRLEELAHDTAVELTGIDREALLELVKELELGAQCVVGRKWPNMECERMAKHLADDYEMIARRIREALGVES